MPRQSLRVAPLLFFSGLCALVYQVAWLRELRLVFGASTPATAAVLGVFMGGLGYGSLVLSKRADRMRRPLLLYANLEAGIAALAALTPALLAVARAGYVGLGGTTALGMIGGTLARLALSALVLLPPTLLMGGTLPAAARAAI
ncbi:MAG: spermidine synthase, partial [Deltaproteobacteria bacterium]|nr:spermidine synthase [Deltaproteobacteria bacterium]MBW2532759.1 spermidine synthase [Deltaproteobacteria bacterium]